MRADNCYERLFVKASKVGVLNKKQRSFYGLYNKHKEKALLDINTGESRILRADIVQDCGNSLNESIDIGQISSFEKGLLELVKSEKQEILESIQNSGKIEDNIEKDLSEVIANYKKNNFENK